MNEFAAVVLIYDGECAYCSVAVSALKCLDDVEAVLWYDDVVQAFLDVQFADVPLAMILVDRHENRMRTDRTAAKEFTDRAGMPGLLDSLTRDDYDRITKVVGVASGRSRDPDDVHSAYGLEPDTADLSAPLLDNAEPRPAEPS